MEHIAAKVVKNQKETAQVSRLTFAISLDAKPGQFVMCWVPGQDEKPMSIANASPLQIAVADAGPVSKLISGVKAGDTLYIRGPYGKPFEPKGKKWLLVGGGYGFAPLRFLARIGEKSGIKLHSIIGARSKDYLMQEAPGKNYFTTDDGSAGEKGNVMVVLEPLLQKEKFDCIYSCGPEKMMYAVAKAAQSHKIPSQLSVERYMKCGVGACGHCAMGSWLSCIDGPTISGEKALSYPQFGSLACDRSGKKVKL